jgi:hypothetical protein
MRGTGDRTRASLLRDPHAVALLRVCQDRPSNHRAAEPSDEFASSKANAHLNCLATAAACRGA